MAHQGGVDAALLKTYFGLPLRGCKDLKDL